MIQTKTKLTYNHTIAASFIGYITQAIVNNFAPLLFLTFQREYHISLESIAFLITMNFGIQLFIDFLCAGLIDKIGYRVSVVAAHLFSATGLILLGILPDLCGSPLVGIMISVALYAVGGGLIEVLISPIVEACPTKRKEAAMSLLHSFYCWGLVAVVLVSSAFFVVFGTKNWKVLSWLWALIPLCNAVFFTQVPMNHISEGKESGSIKELFQNQFFWITMLLMVCAGASEQSVSQWASAFAEQGLMVSKTAGDLLGPCLFAVLMGTSRALFAKWSEKISLKLYMLLCGLLCVCSYLMITLNVPAAVSFLGFAFCGFSVGIMWPGTFSLATKEIKHASTAMFALLALAGDVGCAAGPALVGIVSDYAGGNLKMGIKTSIMFPILVVILALVILNKGTSSESCNNSQN